MCFVSVVVSSRLASWTSAFTLIFKLTIDHRLDHRERLDRQAAELQN
jgi:hypothetical protein